MSDAGHGQVHTDFGALALEVGAEIGLDILGDIGSDADHVLSGPGHVTGLLDELLGGSAALRTLLGSLGTFVNITANAANILHFLFLLQTIAIVYSQTITIVHNCQAPIFRSVSV